MSARKLTKLDHELLEALKAFQDCMRTYGEWDEGCFYYAGRIASELQDVIVKAETAIQKAEGKA